MQKAAFTVSKLLSHGLSTEEFQKEVLNYFDVDFGACRETAYAYAFTVEQFYYTATINNYMSRDMTKPTK